MTIATGAAATAVRSAREAFASGRTRSVSWRRMQLDAFIRMITDHIAEWEDALAADLGKSADEAHLTEIGILLAEARLARARVGWWAAPRPVAVGAALQPAAAWVRPQPLGTALIIAPWNYPMQLQLAPLIGALAAGCTAVLKPSELAPATADVIARLVPRHLDGVRVVTGGVDASQALLAEQFDVIFYTGGERVGKIVAHAAAENLTPTVLELGGTCPVWVDASADLEVAARRIVWAKLMNAGQTCVAPNHVWVDRRVSARFVEAAAREITAQAGLARDSADFGRIVSETHAQRLAGLLSDGQVVTGGDVEVDARFVAPTILTGVAQDAASVTEEIFGPILPVLEADGVSEFIEAQRARPRPLALYAFAQNRRVLDRIERETVSGGYGRNVAVAHLQVTGLPFGGVGASGYGAYHGKRSFDAFTHAKAVLAKPAHPDTLRVIIPPVTPTRRTIIRRLLTRS
ncbi:MAG: aldehyde dehydrogenase family protein [Microbacterium sp.]